MDKLCSFCLALKLKSDSSGMCCKNRKIKLPHIELPPDDLLSYTSGDTPESKHFLKNIRIYNACFQMTSRPSFGASTIIQQTGSVTTFTVKGHIYHKTGSLLPILDHSPKFLQIYFMGDERLESDQRCKYITGVKSEIVMNLQRMFHQEYHLIKAFKTALERMLTDEYKLVITADQRPKGEHERSRFNAPQLDEAAVVISGDEFGQCSVIAR